MAAAQLFATARQSDPGIVLDLATGNFEPLMHWLRKEVHSLGARYSTNALLERATGQPLNQAAFKAHLKARYLEDLT